MTKILLFFLVMLLTNLGYSQKKAVKGYCGVENKYDPNLNIPPPSPGTESDTNSTRLVSQNGLITIPVVFHVVYNTAAENISFSFLQSQINRLNTDFRKLNPDVANTPAPWLGITADINIEFKLACIDPSGQFTDGVTRSFTGSSGFVNQNDVKDPSTGGVTGWPTDKYLNIWVCDLADVTNALGWATFPGQYTIASNMDGVVLDYSCVGDNNSHPNKNYGRIATHEIGHWLGLRHFFGGGALCAVDVDEVPDTPTTTDTEGFWEDCPSGIILDICNPINPGEMYMNYMQYTNDPCMYMFTNGQRSRMRSFIDAPGINSRYPFLENYFGFGSNPQTNFYVCGSTTLTIPVSNPMCIPFTPSIIGDASIVSFSTHYVEIQTNSNPSGNFTLTLTTTSNYEGLMQFSFSPPPPPIVPTITAIGLDEMCQPPNTQTCVPTWFDNAIVTYQAPAGYGQYEWTPVEGVIIAQNMNSVTIEHPFMSPPPVYYGVRLRVANSSCSWSNINEMINMGCVGCDPPLKNSAVIKIFPNPVVNNINLELTNNKIIKRIIVKDISGISIIDKISNNSQRITFDFSKYKEGIYYIQVFDGTNWMSSKFIKK